MDCNLAISIEIQIDSKANSEWFLSNRVIFESEPLGRRSPCSQCSAALILSPTIRTKLTCVR